MINWHYTMYAKVSNSNAGPLWGKIFEFGLNKFKYVLPGGLRIWNTPRLMGGAGNSPPGKLWKYGMWKHCFKLYFAMNFSNSSSQKPDYFLRFSPKIISTKSPFKYASSMVTKLRFWSTNTTQCTLKLVIWMRDLFESKCSNMG